MRKTAIVATMLLIFAAWSVAQSSPSHSTPGSTSSQSATPSTSSSSTSSQAPSASQTPSMPSTSQAPSSSMPSSSTPSSSGSDQASAPSSAAGGDMVEGCLGGAAPDFTVTDKMGTTYKLVPPPGADTSVLTKHLGESVQAVGTIGGGGSSASSSTTPTSSTSSSTSSGAPSTAGASGGEHTIQVTKIGRGSGSCPASGSKPPSK